MDQNIANIMILGLLNDLARRLPIRTIPFFDPNPSTIGLTDEQGAVVSVAEGLIDVKGVAIPDGTPVITFRNFDQKRNLSCGVLLGMSISALVVMGIVVDYRTIDGPRRGDVSVAIIYPSTDVHEDILDAIYS